MQEKQDGGSKWWQKISPPSWNSKTSLENIEKKALTIFNIIK